MPEWCSLFSRILFTLVHLTMHFTSIKVTDWWGHQTHVEQARRYDPNMQIHFPFLWFAFFPAIWLESPSWDCKRAIVWHWYYLIFHSHLSSYHLQTLWTVRKHFNLYLYRTNGAIQTNTRKSNECARNCELANLSWNRTRVISVQFTFKCPISRATQRFRSFCHR